MPSGGQNKGKRSFPLTEEQIRREYLDKDVSMKEAASVLGCTIKILWQACKDHGLPAKSKARGIVKGRPPKHAHLADHDWLKAQIETRTFADIARELGVHPALLIDYMQRHKLYEAPATPRDAKIAATKKRLAMLIPKAQKIAKEDIIREYLEQDRNIYDACKVLHCSAPTLMAALDFHGLPAKETSRKIAIPGQHSPRWTGGRIQMRNGYIAIRSPEHPHADKAGNVMEHRLVAERMLGRYLTKEEHVHHINRIRSDNREENLMVLTKEEHRRLHRLEDARAVQELEEQDTLIHTLKTSTKRYKRKLSETEQRLARYEALYGPLPGEPEPSPRPERQEDGTPREACQLLLYGPLLALPAAGAAC